VPRRCRRAPPARDGGKSSLGSAVSASIFSCGTATSDGELPPRRRLYRPRDEFFS